MSSHEPSRGAALAAALLLVIALVAGIVLIQFLVDQPYRPAASLDRPPGRRFGRGPSLEALRVLIASLERRR